MGRRPISASISAFLVVVGLIAVSAMAVAAQADQEPTTTEAVDPGNGSGPVDPADSGAEAEPTEVEDPEPDDVPLGVWIALGLVLVAAIAWGLEDREPSDGDSDPTGRRPA